MGNREEKEDKGERERWEGDSEMGEGGRREKGEGRKRRDGGG